MFDEHVMEEVVERRNMQAALQQVRANQGSPGIDGMCVDELPDFLKAHWPETKDQLLNGTYRPMVIRRVEIPKLGSQENRKLGIPCVLDRLIQQAILQVLQGGWDPTFSEFSYGFRPGRSAHQAVAQAQVYIEQGYGVVVDIDLKNFFDTMPHTEVLAVLAQRIRDKRFLRLIARMLKAGIQTPGGVVHDELGSPQGSIVSPVIANVFLDTVLDQWFAPVVTAHCRGYCAILRYADDALMLVEREDDARRFMRVLPLRLGKFGLRLNAQKTQLVPFGKHLAGQALQGGRRPATVDSLGFTHYGGRSRNGRVRVKRKTSKKRLRRAVVELNRWLCLERHTRKLPDLWQAVARKMRGHFNYFGVTDNSRAWYRFERAVHTGLFKWLNRRSQRRSFTWEGFRRYAAKHPLPRPGRLVSMYPAGGKTG
jgi:group II intron reverse transcriptase/maturase